MKLLKNKRFEQGDGQCAATTNSGSRCARSSVRKGYCKQHYKLLKAQGLIVEAKGRQPITRIPGVPEELDVTGRKNWQIYCQYLIDRGRLFEIHLLALANLCYLEDQLEEVKKEIEEHGSVNFYENGIQRNGFASHFDKLLTHIRSLRADLGLTAATDKDTAGSGSAETQKPKEGYENQKAKNW